MSIYLGIHDGHNSAAALFMDGKIVYALQEERLTGIKNFFGFPEKSVDEILKMANISPEQIDKVCMASNYQATARDPRSFTEDFENRYKTKLRHKLLRGVLGSALWEEIRVKQRTRQRKKLMQGWSISEDKAHFYDHHTAHAATAYYGMKEDNNPYLVLTLDGGGDRLSASVSIGKNGKLKRIAETPQTDSLGEIYAVTTHMLGFIPLEHEYKLMGMAAYASPKYSREIAEIFHQYIALDTDNPMVMKRKVSEPLSLIGSRLQEDLQRKRFDVICAGLQQFTEEIITDWVKQCIRKTGIDRVLVAGGVFMNVKANKTISELPEVKYFQAFPSCGDESLVFGTCYLAANEADEEIKPIKHYYFGNDISEKECQQALMGSGYQVEKPDNMAQVVADLLAKGEVVARASGPMEFGARALGNRSIIADPINGDVVREINQMIKKRDFWMPFAPVLLKRNTDEVFKNPKNLPSSYMMNTFDSTDKRTEYMAAVHNADFTARPQIVEPGQSKGYEDILEEFEKLTGRKVLLNTSFNLHGLPIVCRALDALYVMKHSSINWLILGPYLVSKKGI